MNKNLDYIAKVTIKKLKQYVRSRHMYNRKERLGTWPVVQNNL